MLLSAWQAQSSPSSSNPAERPSLLWSLLWSPELKSILCEQQDITCTHYTVIFLKQGPRCICSCIPGRSWGICLVAVLEKNTYEWVDDFKNRQQLTKSNHFVTFLLCCLSLLRALLHHSIILLPQHPLCVAKGPAGALNWHQLLQWSRSWITAHRVTSKCQFLIWPS